MEHSDEELEEMLDVTAERIDELDGKLLRGEIPGETAGKVIVGGSEITLEELKPVKDTSFRQLVGHAVYLKDAFSYLSRSPEELGLEVEGYPDVIAYCYVDDELGMCFSCLCAAREADGVLELLDAFDEVSLTMRRATVADALCMQISRDVLAAFADALAALEAKHAVDDFTQGMRELTELDDLRNPDFPDAIKTVLMNPNDPDTYELVWARPWATSDDAPQCVLMSEPANEALGAHEGDVFPLIFQRQPDGLIAIALAVKSVYDKDAVLPIDPSYGSSLLPSDMDSPEDDVYRQTLQ